MKIAVLGAGSWGTALGLLLSSKQNDVYMWTHKKETAQRLLKERVNEEYLPSIALNDNMYFSDDIKYCIDGARLIVTAVPSHVIRETAKKAAPFIKKDQVVLNVSKGLETDSLKRLSQVLKEEMPGAEIAVMSGPSHAEEVARMMPTTNVVASEDENVSAFVQEVFMHPNFRVYTNSDIVGVEIGGALKNVIALAAGISAGLGCGDNALAALMTRGICEIARLGVKMGASLETFSGLSGIGDLIVTCMSKHSRNRKAGLLIGQGIHVDEALKQVHMVVEGVRTCRAASELAKKYGVSMPITECTYKVLFEDMPAVDSISNLMGRAKKNEAERDVLGEFIQK